MFSFIENTLKGGSILGDELGQHCVNASIPAE